MAQEVRSNILHCMITSSEHTLHSPLLLQREL
jgi:hypothetical protein